MITNSSCEIRCLKTIGLLKVLLPVKCWLTVVFIDLKKYFSGCGLSTSKKNNTAMSIFPVYLSNSFNYAQKCYGDIILFIYYHHDNPRHTIVFAIIIYLTK